MKIASNLLINSEMKNIIKIACTTKLTDPTDFLCMLGRLYKIVFQRLLEVFSITSEMALSISIKFMSLIETISFFTENSDAINSIDETKKFILAHVSKIFDRVDWVNTEYGLVLDYFENVA